MEAAAFACSTLGHFLSYEPTPSAHPADDLAWMAGFSPRATSLGGCRLWSQPWLAHFSIYHCTRHRAGGTSQVLVVAPWCSGNMIRLAGARKGTI